MIKTEILNILLLRLIRVKSHKYILEIRYLMQRRDTITDRHENHNQIGKTLEFDLNGICQIEIELRID